MMMATTQSVVELPELVKGAGVLNYRVCRSFDDKWILGSIHDYLKWLKVEKDEKDIDSDKRLCAEIKWNIAAQISQNNNELPLTGSSQQPPSYILERHMFNGIETLMGNVYVVKDILPNLCFGKRKIDNWHAFNKGLADLSEFLRGHKRGCGSSDVFSTNDLFDDVIVLIEKMKSDELNDVVIRVEKILNILTPLVDTNRQMALLAQQTSDRSVDLIRIFNVRLIELKKFAEINKKVNGGAGGTDGELKNNEKVAETRKANDEAEKKMTDVDDEKIAKSLMLTVIKSHRTYSEQMSTLSKQADDKAFELILFLKKESVEIKSKSLKRAHIFEKIAADMKMKAEEAAASKKRKVLRKTVELERAASLLRASLACV
jgi:hypothetical protein